jgi:hypothetical protein
VTELSALHAKIQGDANGLTAAIGTARKGVESFQKSAESSAKVFERAFKSQEKAVDNLRRAIDPVYAASKRYESAVEKLDAALKSGALSQAAHTRMMDQASAAYLRSQGAANTMGQRLGFLGGMSDQARGKIQQVGFQVQDFAVQVGAGTSATQAFAQQFPQLAGAFGPVGVAIGTLAAIGIPLLVAAFGSATTKADEFTGAAERQKESLASLVATTEQLAIQRQKLFSGAQSEEEQKQLNEVKRLTEERVKAQAELNNLVMIGGRAAAFQDEAQAKRDALQAEIAGIDAKLEALNKQRELKAAAEEFKGTVELALSVQQAIASTDISGPWRNVLGSIQTAIGKAREYAQAQALGAGLPGGGMGRGASPGGPLIGSPDLAAIQAGGGVIRPMPAVGPSSGGGGGGGGGGAGNTAEIDSLRQSLMTKEEVELESYTRRQEALQTALNQRMITEDEFRRMSEQAQQQHADKMTQIDVWKHGTALDKADAFFGSMADATKGGNEEMLKINKAFGAAQALISAWQGAAEALKLPFPANMAAFAKVLATGLGAVNAIKGAGKGASSSGGARAASSGIGNTNAAPTQSSVGTFINLALQGQNYGPQQIRDLIGQINKAVEDGAVIKGLRVV